MLAYEPADLTISVQAGVTFAALDAVLAAHGQRLALDCPHAEAATLGGLLATNLSGPRRLRYGTARDMLIGVRAAHPDGTLTRGGGMVVKNVSGYDMMKLYVGSLGTLAVLVELNFKLSPRPPAEGTAVLAEARQLYCDLPSKARERVHLACLPMDDLAENAAIVNALQRRADVVVQLCDEWRLSAETVRRWARDWHLQGPVADMPGDLRRRTPLRSV